MIIFINDNSTIRLKGQHAEGDTLALARPRQPKGTTALKEYSTTKQRKCALKLHTRIYKTHQPIHTHTHTDTHIHTTQSTPDWWVDRTTAPVWAF